MRNAVVERKTTESDICVRLEIDGEGKAQIDTGIPFFDHMLNLFAKHSKIDLTLTCRGDVEVDAHHSVEDTGIALGKAFFQAVGDKKGIERYAGEAVAMDECLCLCAADVCGRAYLVFNADLSGSCASFDAELAREFFQAFVSNSFMTLHVNLLYGENLHHKIEAIFKGAARAIHKALTVTGDEIPSTKGVL